jgi:hypothetical protein
MPLLLHRRSEDADSHIRLHVGFHDLKMLTPPNGHDHDEKASPKPQNLGESFHSSKEHQGSELLPLTDQKGALNGFVSQKFRP